MSNLEAYKLSYEDYDVYPWFYRCNWGKAVKVKTFFETVVARSKDHYEQRRPLYRYPQREVEASFLMTDTENQRIVNDIAFLLGKIVLFPIYSEVMRPTNVLYNQVYVYTNDPFEYYFHLNCANVYNTQRLIFSDEESGLYNTYLLDDILVDRIEVSALIGENYAKESTWIWPAVFGVIEKPTINPITDNCKEIIIKFKETILHEDPDGWVW